MDVPKCKNRGATTISVGFGSSSSLVAAAATTTKTTIPPKGSFYPSCSSTRGWNQVLRVGTVVLACSSYCFQLVVHVNAEAIPATNFFEGSRHLGVSSSSANNNYYFSIEGKDNNKAKKGTSSGEGEKHGRSQYQSSKVLTATTPTTTSSSTRRSNNGNGTGSSTSSSILPIRVAYQGEPGAYSEKATRELLGDGVMAVAQPNFESCFQAVAVRRDCDFACIPVENSLGGSIHENYDLMLRYPSLSIVAEHEFRVHHCLLVSSPHIRNKQDIRYAISHPQALAQCDTYLRTLGITPIPLYDTAGSAKLLADAAAAAAQSHSSTNTDDTSSSSTSSSTTTNILPPGCTPQNTAAIASDLAGITYGLHCLEKGIEDDDSNFTRFLLLGRQSVLQFLHNKQIPSKVMEICYTIIYTYKYIY
jgi:prephenate dehydratase